MGNVFTYYYIDQVVTLTLIFLPDSFGIYSISHNIIIIDLYIRVGTKLFNILIFIIKKLRDRIYLYILTCLSRIANVLVIQVPILPITIPTLADVKLFSTFLLVNFFVGFLNCYYAY